jgi:hypothetical protein
LTVGAQCLSWSLDCDDAVDHIHAALVLNVAGLRERDGDLDRLVERQVFRDLLVANGDHHRLRAGCVGRAGEDERGGDALLDRDLLGLETRGLGGCDLRATTALKKLCRPNTSNRTTSQR